MEPFLRAVTTFPTAPLTVMLGVVVGYWIFALVTGAAFHSDAASGGLKAAGDAVSGAVKGAGEAVAGAIKGTAEAVTGGHGDVDGDVDGGHEGGLLSLLGVGRVPVTITLSATTLVAWTACALATLWLEPANLVTQGLVLLGSLVTGLLGAALFLRPLGKALDQAKPARRKDYLGHLCTVTSGKVDSSFGTAQVDDGAAGLNVHVVCPKANGLKKGDRALLVDFDPSKDVYQIEPVDWLMPEEIEALNDPSRVAQIISGRIKRR